MKKILALLVVTVLLLTALTACGSKSSSITIAVPNDATNEARALLLLQDNGYIKLKDGAGITATINDIAENPKNITFNEVEAAQVPNVLKDVDYAIINSNYAIPAGLNPTTDSLLIEGSASAYGNVLVVKEGNEETDKIKALKAAVASQQVADYITETYGGAVVSVVENPGNGYDDSVELRRPRRHDHHRRRNAHPARRGPLRRQGDPGREGHHPRHQGVHRLRPAEQRRGERRDRRPTTSSTFRIWMTSTPRTARTSSPFWSSTWSRWASTAASRPALTR